MLVPSLAEMRWPKSGRLLLLDPVVLLSYQSMALLTGTYFCRPRGAHAVMSDSSADKQVGMCLHTDSTFVPSPSHSSH